MPDQHVTVTVDVSDCTDRKLAAILAHRSGAARERPLHGILSRLPAAERGSIIATEYFTLLGRRPVPGGVVLLQSR
ncbi:hypothetical protein ACWCPD_41105 [Streptomyces sp. NPDC001935]